MLQPLRWCCVDCVIHHERDVREEQHHTGTYMWHEQAIIEWSWHVNSIVACCHSAKLAHMPLGISDRNKMVLWPGLEMAQAANSPVFEYSQTFYGHVPLQDFVIWAWYSKISYDKKAEENKSIYLLYQ